MDCRHKHLRFGMLLDQPNLGLPTMLYPNLVGSDNMSGSSLIGSNMDDRPKLLLLLLFILLVDYY
jgi:hypothetical protein